MIYSKQDALVSLRPQASYTWIGNDYSGLTWLGSGSAPTDAEITAELNRLNAAEPERLLREKRDELLAETDWVVTQATETGGSIAPVMKTYRQALRDLPASVSPKLDSNGDLDMSSVTFPTEPS